MSASSATAIATVAAGAAGRTTATVTQTSAIAVGASASVSSRNGVALPATAYVNVSGARSGATASVRLRPTPQNTIVTSMLSSVESVEIVLPVPQDATIDLPVLEQLQGTIVTPVPEA